MWERLVRYIFQYFLGNFITGLESENIKFYLLGGKCIIQDVGVKQEAIDMLGLPLKLKFSLVEKVQISFPWTELSTKSVEIIFNNVFLILNPDKNKQEPEQKPDQIEEEAKKTTQKKEEQKQENEKKSESWLDRLRVKILDNIKIQISNVHFRLESELPSPGFSLGVTIEKVEYGTYDKQ